MDQVRFHVSGGSLKVGDQLPSIRELARQLTLPRQAVARPQHALEDQLLDLLDNLVGGPGMRDALEYLAVHLAGTGWRPE